jgi:hypothetical protein
MGKKKSIGLPGGPNEFLQDITQYISVEGYKRYSDDINNPFNIIDSGNITMEGVDFPVMGTDNLGNSQMMMPGMNYEFPGDQVFEIPMAQNGIEVPKRQGVRKNVDGSESTHLMKAEQLEDGTWVGFPSLFQNEDGKWIDMSGEKDWMNIYNEALKRDEVIEFGNDMESAIKFGEGSWKPKYQNAGEIGNAVMELPNAQLGAMGRAAKPFIKKGVRYLKSFFDDAVSVTDDVVEEVVKKNPIVESIAESVANTPKRLNRPPADDYVFYRYADDESTIMKPLDFENPRIYDSGKITPENLTFFSPNTWAYDGYSGLNGKLFGANIKPKNPYRPYKGQLWDVETVQKLIDEGYDAIMPHYGRGDDIRDAYEIIPLDKNIITNLNRLRKYGGGDLPQAQLGALGRMVKPYAKKGVRYLKDLFESTNDFKSQIDWSKWNKAIPENQKLLQEYNLIEETAKANKTWMKNPDGSKFAGTPEQWVQQRSSNYKKAFGDSKLINPDGSPMVVYHGSPRKFDAFDESMYQLGDAGYSGSGIYTTPSKTTAESYTISGKRFHDGEIEPTLYELYGRGNNPITSKELIDNSGGDIGFGKVGELIDKNLPTSLFNFHRKGAPRVDQLLQYDVAIKNQNRGISNIRPIQDAWEIVFPSNKQLKSSIGNNGMFDMTNPNIYKQIGGSTATISAYEEPGFFENLADMLASPMTSFGYSARNENIPDGLNVNNPDRNTFDSVIDMVNPFAWKQYAENASDNVEKGEYLDATFDALGAIPIVPAWVGKGKNFKGPIKETIKKVLKKGEDLLDQAGLEKYQDKGEVEKNLDALNKQLAKKTYNPYRDIDKVSQKRRTELTDAINFIVDNQGGDENLRDLLIMTAFMENSYGANADAYGRDYTRGPMSIDDIAYKHMFEIRKGANDYTSSQKKYIDWFDSMGYDLDNMDDYLRNDVRANVAASRYQYGTNKNPLPSSKDPKALYNYYMDTYNRTDENHYDRFLKGYNEFIGKKEFGGSVNKYLTYKKFMNGGYTGNDKIEAEKIYDKLNRMHYRDAKQRGLSPQNYIMTNLLGNS